MAAGGYYAEMTADSESEHRVAGRARWIAAGFLAAFATSVLTVIYTGLMVEGSRGDFDAGFRSVTMQAGETQTIRFVFDSPVAEDEARFELSMPAMLMPADTLPTTIALRPGSNEFAISFRAESAGSGYLIARALGEQPLGLDRVFVTVTAAD